MGRCLAVVVGLGIVLAGCGRAADRTSARDVAPAATPALEGTFATLAVAGSDRGAVVVVSSDGDDGPATTLVVSDGAAGLTPVVVPSPDPLYAVATWLAGERVAVLGAACEAWTSGEPPEWVDERDDNVVANCGGTRYELWLWDGTSSRWDQVPTPDLDSANGYALLRGDRTGALLAGRGPGSSRLLVLDVDSGAVVPLPDPPPTDGSAEVRFTPCVDDEAEAYGLLSWTGPAPSVVERAGWAPAVAAQGDGAGSFVVVAARGGAWEPVVATGTVTDWSGVAGCGPDGIWAGRPGAGAVLAREAGTATISPLPPLPVEADGSPEISLHGTKGEGRAVAVVQGPPGDAPDEPREATAYLLDGEGWRSLPAVPLGPASSPFVDGARIASADHHGSGLAVDLGG